MNYRIKQLKSILKPNHNIWVSITIFIAGAIFGVSVTLNIPAKIEAQIKQQSLHGFYSKIASVTDKQDWSKLYDLESEPLKNKVTRDEFTAYMNSSIKGKTLLYLGNKWYGTGTIFSQQTTINNVQINKDNGIVNSTVVICRTKVCTGNGYKKATNKSDFVYVNGKWQMVNQPPSDRALKVAIWQYQGSVSQDATDYSQYFNSPNQGKTVWDATQKKYVIQNQTKAPNLEEDFINLWGYGSKDANFAINNYAINLDQDSEQLIYQENLMQQEEAQKNRPVYMPPTVIQQPAYHPSIDCFNVGGMTSCF